MNILNYKFDESLSVSHKYFRLANSSKVYKYLLDLNVSFSTYNVSCLKILLSDIFFKDDVWNGN